jgi:hypothetical protein
MPTNQEFEQVKATVTDHEIRLRAVEKGVTVMQATLDSMLGILKWIAGITASIAAGLMLNFLR